MLHVYFSGKSRVFHLIKCKYFWVDKCSSFGKFGLKCRRTTAFVNEKKNLEVYGAQQFFASFGLFTYFKNSVVIFDTKCHYPCRHIVWLRNSCRHHYQPRKVEIVKFTWSKVASFFSPINKPIGTNIARKTIPCQGNIILFNYCIFSSNFNK